MRVYDLCEAAEGELREVHGLVPQLQVALPHQIFDGLVEAAGQPVVQPSSDAQSHLELVGTGLGRRISEGDEADPEKLEAKQEIEEASHEEGLTVVVGVFGALLQRDVDDQRVVPACFPIALLHPPEEVVSQLAAAPARILLSLAGPRHLFHRIAIQLASHAIMVLNADQSQPAQSMRQSRQGRPGRQGTPSNRRSSIHFQYDSSEEHREGNSRARNPDLSITRISSNNSGDTVKNTNFNCPRDTNFHGDHDPLSDFDQPIFDIGPAAVDSKRDSREDQEVFWHFLEEFGRDSDSSSRRTINPRSSSRIESSDQYPRRSEAGSKLQKHPENLISETHEEESSRKPNQQPPTAPQRVTAETQTSIKPPRPSHRAEREKDEIVPPRLTFRKFQEVEQVGRYPVRAARECRPLRYWEHEKIDYRRGGYWVSEKEQ